MGKIIIIRVPRGKEQQAAAAVADAAKRAGRKVAQVSVKIPRKSR